MKNIDRMVEILRATFDADVSDADGYVHVYEWPACICDEDEDGVVVTNAECQAHAPNPTIVYERIPGDTEPPQP